MSAPAAVAAKPSDDPGPWLVFHIGIARSSHPPHRGTFFAVDVDDGTQTKTVYRAIWGDPAWLPQAVNLSEFAGRSVLIRLKTVGVYNTALECYPLWGEPTIVTGPLLTATPSLNLLDAPILRNFAGSAENPALLDEDPEVDGGLKLDALHYAPTQLAYGPNIPSFFIAPWYLGQHKWHQVEFRVDVPARPPVSASPSVAKPVAAAAKKIPFRVEGSATVAHFEGGVHAEVDEAKLQMSASMGPPRDAGLTYGYAFSALHVVGLQSALLKVQLSPSLPAPLAPSAENAFAGIVLDYHTPDGWSRRVFLNAVDIVPAENVPPGRSERRIPNWNLDLEMVSVGEETDREVLYERLDLPSNADSSMDLPLAKYAPPNWDGGLWLGIGLQEVEADTTLEATILKTNP